MDPTTPADPRQSVGQRVALRAWATIAINSFGGPAGQIAVMHRVLVDERRWISEQRFLHALNYCMLLPGPEAHQLSVYIGWLLHGIRGALLAGLLFIAPGFGAILALSILYAGFSDTAFVAAVFYGLKPAVLAIVAAAVVRVAGRALTTRGLVAIAIVSFAAIAFIRVPYPAVIAAAGLGGWWSGRRGLHTAGGGQGGRAVTADGQGHAGHPVLADHDPSSRPSARRTLAILVIGGGLWLVPVALLVSLFGPRDVYASQALFFSGAAVVTFGGAYAVLTYVADQVVRQLGWLTPSEMLDGLAMAETTPGPLIMVVEYVGFLAAYHNPGALEPMVAGVLGAILVTWVTFVPSFLWVLAGAPYAEYVRGNQALRGILTGITAAVVGAILNLGAWFTIHTLFASVDERQVGPVWISVPDLASLDVAALVIAGGASVAVFRLRAPMLLVLAASGLVGAAWYVLTR